MGAFSLLKYWRAAPPPRHPSWRRATGWPDRCTCRVPTGGVSRAAGLAAGAGRVARLPARWGGCATLPALPGQRALRAGLRYVSRASRVAGGRRYARSCRRRSAAVGCRRLPLVARGRLPPAAARWPRQPAAGCSQRCCRARRYVSAVTTWDNGSFVSLFVVVESPLRHPRAFAGFPHLPWSSSPPSPPPPPARSVVGTARTNAARRVRGRSRLARLSGRSLGRPQAVIGMAHYHPIEGAAGGFDGSFGSQPPPPLPFSQLGSQPVPPGLSQLFGGGHFSYGNGSLGLPPMSLPPLATPGVGGLLALPLPSIGRLPPLAASQSPSALPWGAFPSGNTAGNGHPPRAEDGGDVGGVGGAPASACGGYARVYGGFNADPCGGYLPPGTQPGSAAEAWIPPLGLQLSSPPASPPPPSLGSPTRAALDEPLAALPANPTSSTRAEAADTRGADSLACPPSSSETPAAAPADDSVTTAVPIASHADGSGSPSTARATPPSPAGSSPAKPTSVMPPDAPKPLPAARNPRPVAPTGPPAALTPRPAAATPRPVAAISRPDPPAHALVVSPSPPVAPERSTGVPASSLSPAGSSRKKVVPVCLGPGGTGLMQAIATLARQLIDGHRGPVKLTGFYAVLQAETGDGGANPKSIIIDCYGAKRTVEEKDMMMEEWGTRRCRPTGDPKIVNSGVAVKTVKSALPLSRDADAESSDGGGDAASGSDVADVVYPEITMNGAELLLSLEAKQKGKKTLSLVELGAVLKKCNLRSYKQLTYNIVKTIFKKAFTLLHSRGVRRGDFTWSRVTPPGLLLNQWGLEGATVSADGGSFVPPDNGKARGAGGVDKKRFVLCVAAHLCPFWSAVLRGYMMENPLNKIAVAKRFRQGDDAFANAGGRRSRKKRMLRLSGDVATATDPVEKTSGGKTPTPPAGKDVLDPPADDGELPLAMAPLSQLAQATQVYNISDLLLLDPAPLLPSSTRVSILALPANEIVMVRHAEDQLRVVLPRDLLKQAFRGLAMSDGSGRAVSLDRESAGDARLGGDAARAASAVVCMAVGKHSPMQCSTASLINMSSVHSLNEQLKMCAAFSQWLQPLRKSTAEFPWQLEFLVGSLLSVGAASEFVWSACTERRVGDPAWRYFLLGAGSEGDKLGSRMYGGCTVAYSDLVLGGQREYMTNGVLDAALVEMRLHSVQRHTPAYVLLTGQSASFTTCNKKRVDEAVALEKVKEIYDVMPHARYHRFVMLLNLVGQHWISAEVVPDGHINIFDSSDGCFMNEKDFAVSRVQLFAREMDRLRRLGDPSASVVDKWNVSFVNTPYQRDAYNCGPFALAHLWCALTGEKLGQIPGLVGDHMRLGILFTLLHCGKRYEDARLEAFASRRDSVSKLM